MSGPLTPFVDVDPLGKRTLRLRARWDNAAFATFDVTMTSEAMHADMDGVARRLLATVGPAPVNVPSAHLYVRMEDDGGRVRAVQLDRALIGDPINVSVHLSEMWMAFRRWWMRDG